MDASGYGVRRAKASHQHPPLIPRRPDHAGNLTMPVVGIIEQSTRRGYQVERQPDGEPEFRAIRN